MAQISLQGGGRRLAVLLAATLLLATVGFSAGKMLVADRLDHAKKPERWLEAARIEPGNGEYWRHLGEYRQLDFDHADLELSEEYYRKAVEDDPRASRYWMDLGGAYEQKGNSAAARAAFEQAARNYPLSADVKWNYGNFLLRAGDAGEGFEVLHQAVEIDPKLAALAISRCWNSDPDVGHLLKEIVPPNGEGYASALDFFASVHDVDSGLKVWEGLLRLKQPFPLKATFDFMDEMIQELRSADAARVWREAYQANGIAYTEPANHSAVWNGGFEQDIVDGGLDWREYTVFGVNMSLDTQMVHSGARAMRIDFIGASNPDFNHLFQWVAVEPDQKYHFQAFVRTEDITTESGVRFVLEDPHSGGGVQIETPNMTGTHPWTAVDADIVTGPDSRVLLLQVVRDHSKLFDNRASGTAWLDDISLVPAGGEGAQTQP